MVQSRHGQPQVHQSWMDLMALGLAGLSLDSSLDQEICFDLQSKPTVFTIHGTLSYIFARFSTIYSTLARLDVSDAILSSVGLAAKWPLNSLSPTALT